MGIFDLFKKKNSKISDEDRMKELIETIIFIDPIINGFGFKEDESKTAIELGQKYAKAVSEYTKIKGTKSFQELNADLNNYANQHPKTLESIYEEFIEKIGKENIKFFDNQLLRMSLSGNGVRPKESKKITDNNKIEWNPEIPVDIKRLIEKSTYYANKKYSNVVFSNGTIVIITDKNKNPEKKAVEILTSILSYHFDFRTNMTDDGNYFVGYNHPAISIIFKEEYDKHREYLLKNIHKALPWHEVLLTQNAYVNTTIAGLLGRTRLWKDFVEQKIVNVHKGTYK